jgi:hypothetical protein
MGPGPDLRKRPFMMPPAATLSGRKSRPPSPRCARDSRRTHTGHRRAARPRQTAGRAGETTGSAQPFQVVETVGVGAEPCLELAHGPGILPAATKHGHHAMLLRLNGDPDGHYAGRRLSDLVFDHRHNADEGVLPFVGAGAGDPALAAGRPEALPMRRPADGRGRRRCDLRHGHRRFVPCSLRVRGSRRGEMIAFPSARVWSCGLACARAAWRVINSSTPASVRR